MNKLKTLYVNGMYKLSMWGAGLVNKTMLHLIELNGLDPDSDPKQLAYLRFEKDLALAVDPERPSKRAYAKVSVPINPGSKHDMPHSNAYKIKSTYPKGGVEDLSNAGEPEPLTEEYLTWKKAPKRPLTSWEVMDKHREYCAKTYTPATDSRQPPIAVAYGPKSEPSEALVAACDNFEEICNGFAGPDPLAQDEKFFNSIDAIRKEFTDPLTSTEQIKELVDVIQKKTAKKPAKKAAKKPAKKSSKRK